MSFSLETAAGPGAWLAAAAVAGGFALHLRRSPTGNVLLALRGAACVAVILALLSPTIVAREEKRARPKLLILLDAGHSMGGKGAGAATRLDQARAWLTRHAARLKERAEVSISLVSDRARPLPGGLGGLAAAAPESVGFKPEEALADAGLADGGTPARVWLISDGVAEGTGDLGRALAGLGAPVDALGVGPARRETGAAFLDLKTPDFAFLHETAPVLAQVEASGLSGRRFTLTLARADAGAPGGWRTVERRDYRAAADQEVVAATFTVRAETLGTERFRLSAEGGGRARTREFRVETVRQKYRVMYLAGRPSHEYAFLRDYLKSDPNYELVSFVILRDPEDPAPADDRELSLIPFPADDIFGRALPQFDLFILENFSAARFRIPPQALESLKRFVANGGALLVKGGENAFTQGGYKNSPLEEILPVTLSARAPDFTPGLFAPKIASAAHPLLSLGEGAETAAAAWAALPPLDGWARFASARAGSEILLSHPRESAEDGRVLPVAAVRPYGRGKVMLISTDSTWRWRLGAAANPAAAGLYARFWARAIQYLTGSLDLSKVKFAPLPDRLPPREPAAFSLRVFDESFRPATGPDLRVSVEWTGPDGKTRAVPARETEPGAWSVELTGLAPGSHRLRAEAFARGRSWGRDEVRFAWEPAGEEPMDRAWLARAAALGGGETRDLATARIKDLLALLPAPRAEAVAARRRRPFAAPFWLALAGALLLLEWALRRRAGHA